MIKYIKAFIKTLRQINDRVERYMLYGLSLMILGTILLFIAKLFVNVLMIIGLPCYLIGLCVVSFAFWEDSKDDFYGFIEKIKKNI